MFDDFVDPFNLADVFDFSGMFEPVSDYLSGYTSANAANRFWQEQLAMQQALNEKNMALQQGYNEKNMALQDDYNVKNIERTDVYQRGLIRDSPSLQVAALRRAGLNPLLAVSNGINSAGTAVRASNPSSSLPSSSTPSPAGVNVQSRLGDLISGISATAGIGSTVADIVLKSAQTEAAKASSAESAARTIKTMKESDSIDPELEKDLKRYPGRLGKESLALRNGVTDPIFYIINSAWNASKDWVINDVEATGRQLQNAKESLNDYILNQEVGRGKHR